MWEKKFVYILNYLKTFKIVQKNNPRTYSLQQNKKAVLTTAAYYKVSAPVRSQGQNYSSFTFIYQKGCFQSKTEKVNSAMEFCIFEIV